MILSSAFFFVFKVLPKASANIDGSGTEEQETMPTKRGVRQASGW